MRVKLNAMNVSPIVIANLLSKVVIARSVSVISKHQMLQLNNGFALRNILDPHLLAQIYTQTEHLFARCI